MKKGNLKFVTTKEISIDLNIIMTQMRMMDDVFNEDIKNGLNPLTTIGSLPFGLNGYGPR